ncbi:MAG: toll/interleukin-1 receptor domain-containing protein, partial [Coriobacteriales bacterium]|nr:toll/interleukin-1 receptor domain-containing protein [Coriobacteriales bacterium]
MSIVYKCMMCGGDLQIADNNSVVKCPWCGSTQTIPKLDSEKRIRFYEMANHYRRNNEFDKAMGVYETILTEDPDDAEAYWSIVLCRYGIEYVEDPKTKKRVPTMNRTQMTSILADEDYKKAVQLADSYAKTIYREQAETILAIQKGILEISEKEEPFDVFICYKETDDRGQRTPDSVLAQELYYQLSQQGYKVFFSRITLEDKLGTAYEPYIFAALQSAKVMVAIGTKAEHFNAAWVRNEWSRYLALIKDGQKKTLIPAYRDMDPSDLPAELLHLQAQDMGKLGFIQDLTRGIDKLLDAGKSQTQVAQAVPATVVATAAQAEPLVKRAFICLEDGEFDKADQLLEQALNLDPENGQAYLGQLMAEAKVRKQSNLPGHSAPLTTLKSYQRAVRFADKKTKAFLEESNKKIVDRNEAFRREKEAEAERERVRKAEEQRRLEAERERIRQEEAAEKARLAAEEARRKAEEEERQRVEAEIERKRVRKRNIRVAVAICAALVIAFAAWGVQAMVSKMQAEAALEESRQTSIGDVSVGDKVYFGRYDGKALQWRVLAVKDGKA